MSKPNPMKLNLQQSLLIKREGGEANHSLLIEMKQVSPVIKANQSLQGKSSQAIFTEQDNEDLVNIEQ